MKKIVLGMLLLALLHGCGGNSSSKNEDEKKVLDEKENNSSTPTSDVNKTVEDKNEEKNETKVLISFNFKNAKLLVSYKEPFVKNNSVVSRINLKSIDTKGEAEDAVVSSYPIRVLYTVTNPKGDKVFVALDKAYNNPDDELDYQTFFSKSHCALYEVSVLDNSYVCVKEGVMVQKMDASYLKIMSSDKKAIQFDEKGNAYFLASSFESNVEKLYQYNSLEKKITELSHDNEKIAYFTVLANGSIVFKNIPTSLGTARLNFMDGVDRIDIEDSLNIDYFTTDNYNSVIYGTYAYQAGRGGIKFARSLESEGVHKATLDTSDLGGQPQRIYIGDDGYMYGLFQESKYIDSIGKYDNKAYLYQLLPRDSTPKIVIELGQKDYYSYVGNTPLQISKGYVYYSETIDVSFGEGTLGTANSIHIVRLSNKRETILLEPKSISDDRIEIYKWRLNGKEIFFSGLNKKGNKLITGIIDTRKVAEGKGKEEYLTLYETDSVIDSSQEIEDIEIVLPSIPPQDSGNAPATTSVALNAGNRYSASLAFSKYMQKQSVIEHLRFTQEEEDISVFPVWIYKTLHLIPDTDNNKANDITKTLEENKTYSLIFEEGIDDLYGWEYAGGTQTATMDYTPPTLKLNSRYSDYQGRGREVDTEFIGLNSTYTEQGAYVVDEAFIPKVIFNDVNTSKEGNYSVTYEAKDDAGNKGMITRKIAVVPLPKIILTDDGAIATDAYGVDISDRLNIFDESSFGYSGGDYDITYSVTDRGYNASVTKHIVVGE